MKTSGRKFVICDTETTGITNDSKLIEVGMLLIDEDFKCIDSLSFLVNHELGISEICDSEWVNDAADAYAVHKIDAEEVMQRGLSKSASRDLIYDFLLKNASIVSDGKPVLISDNAKFEWFMLSQIITVEDYFHYTVWDTNLLFSFAGQTDPKPAHRAMADCFLLYNKLKQVFGDKKLKFVEQDQ